MKADLLGQKIVYRLPVRTEKRFGWSRVAMGSFHGINIFKKIGFHIIGNSNVAYQEMTVENGNNQWSLIHTSLRAPIQESQKVIGRGALRNQLPNMVGTPETLLHNKHLARNAERWHSSPKENYFYAMQYCQSNWIPRCVSSLFVVR